ncbi:Cro/CI family transcriptional regulator [Pseudomonas sp. MYb185]|uniref:Cro/CI family transcriptional regulator n=1 Tax=Pseudomonas sp. MYb185 TaxID=1848729 RepID=UPI000CFBF457|nr:Cro/CI family transcriptional regulator [Pseudomonas sp. MYb185]PRB80513.1 Cro/Cl family transcriptional regulator [Pseudomonas sp. MYb185]
MKRSEAIDFFGGISAVAKVLGVSYEAVRQWPEEGIPLLRQYQLADISGGVLSVSGSSRVSPAAETKAA